MEQPFGEDKQLPPILPAALQSHMLVDRNNVDYALLLGNQVIPFTNVVYDVLGEWSGAPNYRFVALAAGTYYIKASARASLIPAAADVSLWIQTNLKGAVQRCYWKPIAGLWLYSFVTPIILDLAAGEQVQAWFGINNIAGGPLLEGPLSFTNFEVIRLR
jgi:hypothetical protein